MLFALMMTGLVGVAPLAQDPYWTPDIEARLTAAHRQCMAAPDAAQGQHGAMMDCSIAENVKQDAMLNAAYRAARARVSGGRRTELRDAQQLWIGQRDATCQAAFDRAGGGQGSELEQVSCHLRETIVRTMWLERFR